MLKLLAFLVLSTKSVNFKATKLLRENVIWVTAKVYVQ